MHPSDFLTSIRWEFFIFLATLYTLLAFAEVALRNPIFLFLLLSIFCILHLVYVLSDAESWSETTGGTSTIASPVATALDIREFKAIDGTSRTKPPR